MVDFETENNSHLSWYNNKSYRDPEMTEYTKGTTPTATKFFSLKKSSKRGYNGA